MKKIIVLLVFICVCNSIYAADVDVKIFDISLPSLKGGQKEQIKTNVKNNKTERDISVIKTDGIYTIKLDTKLLKGEFKPYYVTNLKTNEEVYQETGARLVVNAGFFDPKNQQTVSYVTIDGQQVLDPHNNKNLVENKHLQPYLDKILNRSELRVLKSNSTGELKYDIALHNDKTPDGYMILHSVQGGPGLVPELRLADEFFVLADKDGNIISQSASSLSKYARTLVGIKDNNVYFIIATNEHPVSLPEAAEILKEAGFEKAMAFDGGGSVSVDFRDAKLHIISDKDKTARKLKSFFIVTDARQANPQAYRFIKLQN